MADSAPPPDAAPAAVDAADAGGGEALSKNEQKRRLKAEALAAEKAAKAAARAAAEAAKPVKADSAAAPVEEEQDPSKCVGCGLHRAPAQTGPRPPPARACRRGAPSPSRPLTPAPLCLPAPQVP